MTIISTFVFIMIFIEKTIEFLLFRGLLAEFRNLDAERKRRQFMADLPQHNAMNSMNGNQNPTEKPKLEDSDDDVSS